MTRYGISRCKTCGKEIIWIKTTAGKNMPCDAGGILCRPDKQGDLTLVTRDGKTIRAVKDETSELVGYTSHFATCPAANGWRKGVNR